MALGSAGLTGTGGSMDKYVPEIWSKRVQAAFEATLVGRQYGLDLSSLLKDMGGDVIHVPKLANRTATTRALTSLAQVTGTGPTEDSFDMNVQTWALDQEQVSDALPAQTRIWQFGQLEGKMMESVARKFDGDLLANYTSFTASAEGTLGSTPNPDHIFSALEKLDIAKCPKEGRIVILGPKTFWDFVRSNVIPNLDYTTNAAKETGRIPQIGGVKVVMSHNVPTSSGSEVNLVMSDEALAFAIAKPLSVQREHSIEYLSDVVVAGMIYGTGCYRPEAGVAVYGR